MSDRSLSLLNVFQVEVGGETRHLICFLDMVLAGARGIGERSVIGEFTPSPDGSFDPTSFRLIPDFAETLTAYLNAETGHAPEIIAQARTQPGMWLYLIDPRNPDGPEDDPPAADVLGCFAVDADGQVVPSSFQYNRNHLWFSPEAGVSGLLSDRRFYDWLHQVD